MQCRFPQAQTFTHEKDVVSHLPYVSVVISELRVVLCSNTGLGIQMRMSLLEFLS